MTFVMMDEMWNSVVIYGPQPEIDRFKSQCFVPLLTGDEDVSSPGFDLVRIVWIETDSDAVETWNFRVPREQDMGSYWFAFDTLARFPNFVFERLAELFPTLAFDCECIADNDTSMGYGWFNPPPGGEEFRDDYAVRAEYWTDGGLKRNAEAEVQHLARVAKLERSISEAEGGHAPPVPRRAGISRPNGRTASARSTGSSRGRRMWIRR